MEFPPILHHSRPPKKTQHHTATRSRHRFGEISDISNSHSLFHTNSEPRRGSRGPWDRPRSARRRRRSLGSRSKGSGGSRSGPLPTRWCEGAIRAVGRRRWMGRRVVGPRTKEPRKGSGIIWKVPSPCSKNIQEHMTRGCPNYCARPHELYD